ncbi:hypothetical protein JCM6882_001831 [Rhodosporidiobolus microsporus]
MAPSSPALSSSAPQSVTIPALLATHDNDPHRALATLVARYNRLAGDFAVLAQEKAAADKAAERAAQENTQLWRSLKAMGNASPRPGTTRRDSDREEGAGRAGVGAGGGGNGTKGLGIEATTTTPTSRTLRRGPSGDSYTNGGGGSLPPPVPSGHHHHPSSSANSSPRPGQTDDAFFDPSSGGSDLPRFPSHHFSSASSPSALRAKAATPPPHASPRQHESHGHGLGASGLRKASSLDLGRAGGEGAAEIGFVEHPATPKTPSSQSGSQALPPQPSQPSPHGHGALKERRPSSPMTSLLGAASGAGGGGGGGRMTSSSSMPLLADPAFSQQAGGGSGSGGSTSRFLPSITPVSPLFTSTTNTTSPTPAAASTGASSPRDREREASFPTLGNVSGAGGEGLQSLQAQIPNGAVGPAASEGGSSKRRERDRTTSANSPSTGAGGGLGSAFLDPLASGGSIVMEGGGLTKQDRRRSMFLPPTRSVSGSLSAAALGAAGGGGAGAGGGLPSTPSTHSLAALAESPAAGVPVRERRPSRTNAPLPPPGAYQPGHGYADSEGSTNSAPATLRRAPAAVVSANQKEREKEREKERVTLTPLLLPQTRVRVGSSNIKMNEKNKEVISFVIDVVVSPSPSPPETSSSDGGAEAGAAGGSEWRVEKMYSDVLALDAAVKSRTSRAESRSMASLPDKSLFKDHAPHKSDQRKAVLERYLQTLVSIPLRDRTAICAFFNSDVLPSSSSSGSFGSGFTSGGGADGTPTSGWLTKRGRNFGGWQTRFYKLEPGRALCYYDSPNGAKLGEIPLHAAAIGRQSSARTTEAGDDNAYLHAFLIRTRDDKDQEADHILCAENDGARDAWVQALTTLQPGASGGGGAGRPSTSSTSGGTAGAKQGSSAANGAAAAGVVPTLVPPSPADTDPPSSAGGRRSGDRRRSGSGPPSAGSSAGFASGEDASSSSVAGGAGGSFSRNLLSARQDLPPSVSLPSDLNALARGMDARSGSGGGKGSGEAGGAGEREKDRDRDRPNKLQPPASRRPSAQAGNSGSAAAAAAQSSSDRSGSPHRSGGVETPPPSFGSGGGSGGGGMSKYSASDVSGPMNAVPLPSGYEFKKAERQKKTKSSFWGFASRSSDKSSTSPHQAPAPPSRPVFGVPLKEAVAISRIRPGLELPAIVYRCVEYLEAKNAEHEEGIFRLSGSANVIRLLKDRFNAEGDVNLLQSNEYYDPHAIAGLLKQYLRELPVHLLTRELHSEFLRVIDLRNRRDRVNALGKLIARLPIEEYTLFRFFFAHLCLIAQNAETSKMNLRNLGIVFSPTLAIPAPLFTLLLAEFDLVFAVEKETGTAQPIMVEDEQQPSSAEAAPAASSSASGSVDATSSSAAAERRTANRNSLLYQASGADKLMEGELTKLREHDENDDEASDAPEESDAFPEPDTAAASTPSGADDTFLSTSSSTAPSGSNASPTLPPPPPPRSPGLPSSPRPGGSFSNPLPPPPPTSSS